LATLTVDTTKKFAIKSIPRDTFNMKGVELDEDSIEDMKQMMELLENEI